MRSSFVDPRGNANQSRVGGLIEDLAGSGQELAFGYFRLLSDFAFMFTFNSFLIGKT